MASHINRPEPGEYRDYADAYVSLVPDDGEIVAHLESGAIRMEALVRSYATPTMAHAPGEWSPQDVLLHVIDNERVFAYRILAIARGETAALPGYEQDEYAAEAGANARKLDELLAEYRAVRAASLALVQGLDEGALTRTGNSDGHALSVRAAAYVLVGHELYHLRSLEENYGAV